MLEQEICTSVVKVQSHKYQDPIFLKRNLIFSLINLICNFYCFCMYPALIRSTNGIIILQHIFFPSTMQSTCDESLCLVL